MRQMNQYENACHNVKEHSTHITADFTSPIIHPMKALKKNWHRKIETAVD
jgi:hypothetical protein